MGQEWDQTVQQDQQSAGQAKEWWIIGGGVWQLIENMVRSCWKVRIQVLVYRMMMMSVTVRWGCNQQVYLQEEEGGGSVGPRTSNSNLGRPQETKMQEGRMNWGTAKIKENGKIEEQNRKAMEIEGRGDIRWNA